MPLVPPGSLRIIAVITHESVITRILRHLQLASVPPPVAPASCRQEILALTSPHQRGPAATYAQRRLISSLCTLKFRLKSFPTSFPTGCPRRRPGKP